MLDSDKVKIAARYQWPQILQSLLGLNDKQTSPAFKNIGAPCPLCGGNDRYSFKNSESGDWACRNCRNGGDGFSLIMKVTGCSFPDSVKSVAEFLRVDEPSSRIEYMRLTDSSLPPCQKEYDLDNDSARVIEQALWDKAIVNASHPWVEFKRLSDVAAGICRSSSDGLLIPVYSRAGARVSHQRVFESKAGVYKKGFHKGIPIKGCLVEFGVDAPVVLIAGSFADVDAAFQLSGEKCWAICAFSDGQIPIVAEYAAEKYPASRIVICADNDESGKSSALKAIQRLPGVAVSFPPSGKDWSEYFLSGGLESPLTVFKETDQFAPQKLTSLTVQSEKLEESIELQKLDACKLLTTAPNPVSVKRLVGSTHEFKFPKSDSSIANMLVANIAEEYAVVASEGVLYRWSEDDGFWKAVGLVERNLRPVIAPYLDQIFGSAGYSATKLNGVCSLLTVSNCSETVGNIARELLGFYPHQI